MFLSSSSSFVPIRLIYLFFCSRDGSINWLSGISAAARADVFSYTTTYTSNFGDYCSLAMNVILQYPNDGTTELDYATLDGGNYLGNTEVRDL